MVILRAALRATRVYGPLVVTRGTVVTAVAALLVGAGAGGALAVVAAVHPVRVVLIAVGLGLVVGGESLIIRALRHSRMPEGSGPVWDRDDALLKTFGRGGETRRVPVEQREDLARWGEMAARMNVPQVLGGVPATLGLIVLLVGCLASDVDSWVLYPLIFAPTALIGIPGLLSAGRGQLAYERATAPAE